jgi:hypothetical protein
MRACASVAPECQNRLQSDQQKNKSKELPHLLFY